MTQPQEAISFLFLRKTQEKSHFAIFSLTKARQSSVPALEIKKVKILLGSALEKKAQQRTFNSLSYLKLVCIFFWQIILCFFWYIILLRKSYDLLKMAEQIISSFQCIFATDMKRVNQNNEVF